MVGKREIIGAQVAQPAILDRRAELADGIVAPVVVGEGTINPFWLLRARKEVHAELADGIVAPV